MKTYTYTDQKFIEITKSGRYEVFLTKPGVETTIEGVFAVANQEKVDIEIITYHQAPHTRAETTLKGVARDQAKIRFLGRIIIEENCGDTNSFLTERILLLSPQATAEAIPELEILSDDVSCSHAASVSPIPEEQIFYLMSRGVSRDKAEQLFVDGFLALD